MKEQTEYEDWCQNPYFDAAARKELKELKSEEEIRERFGRELAFGTGGMRGIMGAGPSRINRYTVRKATQGLANYINLQHRPRAAAAIAYDSRHQSPELAMDAALCLCANGIQTYLFDSLRPTPELSFAVRTLHCIAGIVITASHNPPEYNGYKVYWEDGAQITNPRDGEIMAEVNRISRFEQAGTMDREEAQKAGLLRIIGAEMDDLYIRALTSLVLDREAVQKMAPHLKIVYSPLHGTGALPVKRILEVLGFKHVYVVKEQEKPDGDFPTVASPNPENPEAFTMALELAKRVDADLVLATDPDGDRLGVYARDDRTGGYMAFTGNMSGMLICEYLLSRKQEQGTLPEHGAIVTTIVSGKMAEAAAAEYNVSYIETLTGFKYIGEQIKKFEETHSHEYLFGFEESYGCLAGTYSRDKDAVGAVMALCEAAAYYHLHGSNLCLQMEHLYQKYGYYKESLHTITKKGLDGSREIRRMMDEIRANPPAMLGGKQVLSFRDYQTGLMIDTVSGRKKPTGLPRAEVLYFSLEDHSWACIRPSGTEPKVKIYLGAAEASLQQSDLLLEALWKDFLKRLPLDDRG